MGANVLAKDHNKEYLIDIIGQGKMMADGINYIFYTYSHNGDEEGYKIQVNTESGLIYRINENEGTYDTFGDKEENEHKEGRMNIALISPFNSEVFENTNSKKYKKDYNGNIFGVEFNCYVQEVIELVKCQINNLRVNEVANHMDLCPLHNGVDNIESIPQWLNVQHGLVCNSMMIYKDNDFYKDMFGILQDKNKLYTFDYLKQGISGKWVSEFMGQDESFRKSVNAGVKSLKHKKRCGGVVDYIPCNKLVRFVWFLQEKGYWK